MRTILSVGWSAVLILVGLSLLGWIAYNFFVEMQPEAEGRSPIIPAGLGLILVGFGVYRQRGRLWGRARSEPDEVG